MPPSWKEKGGRLAAFARGNSDGGVNNHAPAPQDETATEKPSEALQAPSNGPSRQELAEAARLPVPAGPRNGTVSHQHQDSSHVASQAHLRSPPRIAHSSPARRRARGDSDDHDHQIFSGSQLGESFMNSGLSTPRNEAEDLEEDATPVARRDSKPIHQIHLQHVERGFPNGHVAASFSVDDNLRMSVVSAVERRGAPQMMDGFYDDVIPAIHIPRHDRHSPLKAVVQSKLPMREVRVKRLPAPGQSAAHAKHEGRSPSPSVESAGWQGQRKRDEQRRASPPVQEYYQDIGGDEESRRITGPDKASDAMGRPVGAAPYMPPTNVALQKLPKERKRRRGSADYDDKILSSMTFQHLRDEPFELDPAKVTGPNGHDASAKLPLKLEQYRQQGVKEQLHIFSSMSFDDWEASGDWFVEQFTDIMKRLRDARRSKRRMVQAFEDEAARREEAVRLRSETIDRKLAKMRQDGQRVVEDKSL